MPDRPLPLEGISVLDLGRIYQGPWAATLLALAGASVVKVEEPSGEPARGVGKKSSIPIAVLNSNKRAITLNLKSERGRELFLDLVRSVDVVVENFGPGTMERLGLGAERLLEINSRLIYAGATAYGIDGPDRDQLGMDITIQAHSGVMAMTGFPDQPPVKAGVPFIDIMGGAYLYAGIVTALFERERTGIGRIVDVAMADTIYPALSSALSAFYRDGKTPRAGNGPGGAGLVPYDVFPTSDGYVAIIVVTEPHWVSLCNAMGQPELATDERFATNGRRYHRVPELNPIITAWTSARTRAEIVAALRAARVPAAAVRDVAEVIEDRHMHERGAIQHIDHPEMGDVVVPHSPLRFRGSALRPLTPAPGLGQHNREVYGELGLAESEIERLGAEGVI